MYALCNANRENIPDLELLQGVCKLYSGINFPEVKLKQRHSEHIEISVKVPYDVLNEVSAEPSVENDSKVDHYFWNTFWEDLNALTQYCDEIHLQMDKNQNLEITLYLSTETSNYDEEENPVPLRFRDLRLVLNFINRIYQDYFVLRVD